MPTKFHRIYIETVPLHHLTTSCQRKKNTVQLKNSNNHRNKSNHNKIQPYTWYNANCVKIKKIVFFKSFCCHPWWWQRWRPGHKARGQEQKKNPRPRTALPRTDHLEAKDGNAQGQGLKIQAQVFSKKKFSKIFSGVLQKKQCSKIFSGDLKKKVFKNFFPAIYKILTIQKILLSSSREQGNFRGLEASMSKVKDIKNVLEDSTFGWWGAWS